MTPAALQLARVHGDDAAGPRGRARGRVTNVTLLLEDGVQGFVGTAADGTAALCELCAGARPPRVGVLTVRGREPSRDHALRRSIGALLPLPALPPWGTVAEFSARLGCEVPWAALGLSGLVSRQLVRLNFSEARAVELAIALHLPRPTLVVLFEPDVQTGPIDRGAVRRRVAALGEAGVLVIVASSDATALRALTQHVFVLDQGRVVGDDASVGWPGVSSPHLHIWLAGANAQQRFTAALEGAEAVLWDAAEGRLAVGGQELSQMARAVARAVVVSGVEVRALRAEGVGHADLIQRARRHQEAIMAEAPSGPLPLSSSTQGRSDG